MPARSCAGMATGWFGFVQPSERADIALWALGRTTSLSGRSHSRASPLQAGRSRAAEAVDAVSARTAATATNRRTATATCGRLPPRMRRSTVAITALLGALVAAPAAFADARGGALYTGKGGRATVRLGVADGGRSIPDYAFSFRRGHCNDGTSWSSALDQRLEPDIDVTAAGRFDVTLSDRVRYTHSGTTQRGRIVSDATGHFNRSGRVVRGTFRQTLKAVHGSFACRSGP